MRTLYVTNLACYGLLTFQPLGHKRDMYQIANVNQHLTDFKLLYKHAYGFTKGNNSKTGIKLQHRPYNVMLGVVILLGDSGPIQV